MISFSVRTNDSKPIITTWSFVMENAHCIMDAKIFHKREFRKHTCHTLLQKCTSTYHTKSLLSWAFWKTSRGKLSSSALKKRKKRLGTTFPTTTVSLKDDATEFVVKVVTTVQKKHHDVGYFPTPSFLILYSRNFLIWVLSTNAILHINYTTSCIITAPVLQTFIWKMILIGRGRYSGAIKGIQSQIESW